MSLLLLFSGSPAVGVVLDAVGPSSAGATSSSSTTLTWTHTSAANTALVVGVGVSIGTDTGLSVTAKLDPAGANTTIPTLGVQVHSGGDVVGFAQLFGLPNVGAGTHTITLTVAGGTPFALEGGSVSYTGAHLTTPFGTQQSATQKFTTTTPGITFASSTANNKIVALIVIGAAITSVATGTGRWLRNVDTASAASNAAMADTAAGGSRTIAWNTPSDWTGIAGVEVLAAPSVVAASSSPSTATATATGQATQAQAIVNPTLATATTAAQATQAQAIVNAPVATSTATGQATQAQAISNPTAATVTALALAPVANSGALASPSTATVTATAPAPVTAQGASSAPNAATVTALAPAPVTAQGALASPTVAAASADAPATQAQAIVNPSSATGTATAQASTSVGAAQSLPSLATASASALASSTVAAAQANPSSGTGSALALAPTVNSITGASSAPTTAAATALAPAPAANVQALSQPTVATAVVAVPRSPTVSNPDGASNLTYYGLASGVAASSALSQVATGGPTSSGAFVRQTWNVGTSSSNGANTGIQYSLTADPAMAAVPGDALRASGWARSSVANSLALYVQYLDSTSTNIGNNLLIQLVAANTWTFFSFTLAAAPAGTVRVRLLVYGSASGSVAPVAGMTLDTAGLNLSAAPVVNTGAQSLPPLASAQAAASVELAPNTGFETDTSGWAGNPSGTVILTRDTTIVHSGTGSLKVAWPAGAGSNTVAANFTYANLVIGLVYRFSGWVYVPAAGLSAVNRLKVVAPATSSTLTVPADTWTFLSITFTASATSSAFQLTTTATTGTGQVAYLDDVSLQTLGPYVNTGGKASPSPTTVSALAPAPTVAGGARVAPINPVARTNYFQRPSTITGFAVYATGTGNAIVDGGTYLGNQVIRSVSGGSTTITGIRNTAAYINVGALPAGAVITFSADVRLDVAYTGTSNTVQAILRDDAAGDSFAATFSTPATLTLGARGVWQRLVYTATVNTSRSITGIYLAPPSVAANSLAAGVGMDSARWLVEINNASGTYFDGDTVDDASYQYDWSGTAGVSQSVAEFQSATARALAPSVLGGALASPTLATATLVAPAPTTAQGALSQPSTSTAQATALAPTVVGAAEVDELAALATAQAPAPSVIAGALVTPLAATGTLDVPAPSSVQGALTQPGTTDARTIAIAPTVIGAAQVNDPPALANVQALAPTVVAGSGVYPAFTDLLGQALAPTVIGGASSVPSPATALAQALATIPSLTAQSYPTVATARAATTTETIPQLSPNTGFETGISGWTYSGIPASLSSESVIVHSGSHSLKVVFSAAASAGTSATFSTSSLIVGLTYQFSAWLYVPSATLSALIRLKVINPAVSSTAATVGDDWALKTVTFVATTSSTSFQITTTTSTPDGLVLYVDDTSLTQVGDVVNTGARSLPPLVTASTTTAAPVTFQGARSLPPTARATVQSLASTTTAHAQVLPTCAQATITTLAPTTDATSLVSAPSVTISASALAPTVVGAARADVPPATTLAGTGAVTVIGAAWVGPGLATALVETLPPSVGGFARVNPPVANATARAWPTLPYTGLVVSVDGHVATVWVKTSPTTTIPAWVSVVS